MSTSKSGWIYVLVNRSMPDLIKVGLTTTSLEQRQKELSSATGVASPFEVYGSLEVVDVSQAEKEAHRILGMIYERPNSSREFFKAAPEDALNVLNGALQKFISNSGNSEMDEATILAKRSSFSLACLQFEPEFRQHIKGVESNLTDRLALYFGTYIASCAAIGRRPIYPHILASPSFKSIFMEQAISIAKSYTDEPENKIIGYIREWT